MKKIVYLALPAVALVAASCATQPSYEERRAQAMAMMKTSFKEKGQAKLDRIDQDDMQRICSQYPGGHDMPKETGTQLEKAQQALIKYPADGKFLGDWKNGEKVAQSGQGKQYSDDPAKPSGGNCYACHQLAPQELSYGTLGPSLYQFGKSRGYTDEVRKYVYGKIYNAEAFSACTSMPRFGHSGILTEQQVKDVVALLMDPNSPVNK